MKWSIGRVFCAECSYNGCKISTGCSVEGSSGTGMLNVVHCPVGIPGSSTLKDMMSITKVVPREFSPFVQKIRYKRMQGYNALWQPGTDHASIATEVKVIESLKEQGIDKDELGREGFLEKAWEWKRNMADVS